MPAKKMQCSVCTKSFWAARSDTLYCSGQCRYQAYKEEIHFKRGTKDNKKSGVAGVKWHKMSSIWVVTVRVPDRKYRKYVGSRRTLEQAIELLKRESRGINRAA